MKYQIYVVGKQIRGCPPLVTAVVDCPSFYPDNPMWCSSDLGEQLRGSLLAVQGMQVDTRKRLSIPCLCAY